MTSAFGYNGRKQVWRREDMRKGGRYGKYGEQKRFERLRQKRKGVLGPAKDLKNRKGKPDFLQEQKKPGVRDEK